MDAVAVRRRAERWWGSGGLPSRFACKRRPQAEPDRRLAPILIPGAGCGPSEPPGVGCAARHRDSVRAPCGRGERAARSGLPPPRAREDRSLHHRPRPPRDVPGRGSRAGRRRLSPFHRARVPALPLLWSARAGLRARSLPRVPLRAPRRLQLQGETLPELYGTTHGGYRRVPGRRSLAGSTLPPVGADVPLGAALPLGGRSTAVQQTPRRFPRHRVRVAASPRERPQHPLGGNGFSQLPATIWVPPLILRPPARAKPRSPHSWGSRASQGGRQAIEPRGGCLRDGEPPDATVGPEVFALALHQPSTDPGTDDP